MLRRLLPALLFVAALTNAYAGVSGGPSGGNAAAPQGGYPVSVAGSRAATYIWFTNAYAGYTTPTDLFCINGSASKTVQVLQINLQINTTSAAVQNLYFIKRSTADTGGTPTSLTAIPTDSSDAGVSGSVTTYGSAPSTGSAVGTYNVQIASSAAAAAAPAAFQDVFTSTSNNVAPNVSPNEPITLHGTAEGVCVNYNGAALTAGFTAQLKILTAEY